MANLNPILKNEPYKYSWLDKPPVVPEDTALILYPHDSREHCSVYLQEDTVFPEAIKKWHLDRLVHITLRSFEFQKAYRYYLSDGTNQWAEITYKFNVSVKPDREAIKVILKNNITDISEPVSDILNTFALDKTYTSLELSSLETNTLRKIQEMTSRISYLRIHVSQSSTLVDDVSKKKISDDKADKLRKAEVEAIERRLARDKEEAEARRKEAEIAREKAETEKQLAEIRRQAELDEQKHEIDKKTKEVAAQKAYQLQQAENVAAIAQAQLKNVEQFGLENLAPIDPSYQGHINSQQDKIDRERDNRMKDLELVRQKIYLIKEMVESHVIDDMTAGQMTQQLLIGSSQPISTQRITSSTNIKVDENDVINISEDGKADV